MSKTIKKPKDKYLYEDKEEYRNKKRMLNHKRLLKKLKNNDLNEKK